MDIFTGQITNWDSPQITRDYGTRLPDLPIIPVIHADLAGTTYYFTRWMAHVFPRQWNAFCTRVNPQIKPPCGQTEAYPLFGNAKAENGSFTVTSYIASSAANGAIGYDESVYAAYAHLPVAALRNPAGRYVLPTATNVTMALTAAVIVENPHSPNYLQETLDALYTYKNRKSYPLASYSYFIVPAAPTTPPIFRSPPGKGKTLSTYIVYALCQGQRQVTALGSAPLPANLVAGGLKEVRRIPGHVPVPTLAACMATPKGARHAIEDV